MRQKLLALLLTVTMLFSMSAAAISALAASNPTISLEKKEAYVGDEVSIAVSIENNPGIWGMDLRISYDKTAMTLISVENGNFYQNSEWTKGNLNADAYTLSYEAGALENISTASGTLAILNFKINENAAPGTYEIKAEYNAGDIINVSFDELPFDISNGSITVASKPVSVTGISLDKETASIKIGDRLTLTPIFSPEAATNKNVTWTSSDKSVATVENGIVTPFKKGTATITVTTEDGGFSASCVVTVNCSHLNTTDITAEESTCITHGHKAYTVCNDCGEITKGSDSELPFGNHTGGTATCVKKAVCDVCHKEYGDLAAHKYTETIKADYLKTAATCGSKAVYFKSCSVCGVQNEETFETGDYDYTNHIGETYLKNQKEATCLDEGYTGDTYCRTCNREISKGQPIAKSAHNPASVWTTDETSHWKECQTVGCGNIIDKAAHSGGEATCTNKAICSVCKVEYGTVDPSNHKHTEVRNAKEATCCEKGYTGDTWCLDCNTKISSGSDIPATGKHIDADSKWETDGTNHWHTCYFGTKFDITAHSGGEATCINKAKCSVCEAEYGYINTSNHKHTELRNVKAATEQEKGYTGDTWCLDCNKEIVEGTEVDKLIHQPKLVEAKEATVTEEGNIRYYYCDGCDKYFTDADGTKEITFEETIIKKLPPEIIEGNNVVVSKGEKKALSFRSNAAFADFISVELDGKILDEANYTKADGSIIVTLNADFVSTLSVGEHTLGVVSESGTATAKFTVKAIGNLVDSPRTGNNDNIAVWSLTAILAFITFSTTAVVSKKRRAK